MKNNNDNDLSYDQISFLLLETDKGFIGSVIQDTITKPAEKKVRIQFSNGFLESYVNYRNNIDAVIYECNNKKKEFFIKKKRSDDFAGIVDHLENALKHRTLQRNSPLNINKSIEVMKIIEAGFKSNKLKKEISI